MKKFDLQKSMYDRGKLVHAGIYRIPRDMSEELAARAERDGMGQWLHDDAPKPEQSSASTPAGKPRGGRKNLGGAPENKSQGGAASSATFPVTRETEGLD